MLNLGLRGQILGTIIFVRMLMLPISHPSGHQITARYTSQSHPCASANLWLIDGLTYSLRLPLEIASPSVPAWPCFVMRTDKTSQPWLGCWWITQQCDLLLSLINMTTTLPMPQPCRQWAGKCCPLLGWWYCPGIALKGQSRKVLILRLFQKEGEGYCSTNTSMDAQMGLTPGWLSLRHKYVILPLI